MSEFLGGSSELAASILKPLIETPSGSARLAELLALHQELDIADEIHPITPVLHWRGAGAVKPLGSIATTEFSEASGQ